jgi:hypothetical protein
MWLRLSGLVALLLCGCGKDLPTLEGIDLSKWKSDKNACSGDRNKMQSTMESEMIKLKGLKEMDIVSLLGRPDANELYKRNQKFYYYFLSPGPACPERDSVTQRLVLRFNAMGYAQLVSIDKI